MINLNYLMDHILHQTFKNILSISPKSVIQRITEVVLLNCTIVNNDYQDDSRVLYTFFSNNLLGHLIGIYPKKFIFI